MKLLTALVLGLLTFTLTACDQTSNELDYSDFQAHIVQSYEELESKEDDIYIAYYYSETCGACANLKPDILTFFKDYETYPFYILNVYRATDVSSFEEFYATPSLFVISEGVILEEYVGVLEITEFIDNQQNVEN